MARERASRCSIPSFRDGLQRAVQRHALASPGRNVAGDAAAPRHDLVSCRHGHPAAVDEAPATRGSRNSASAVYIYGALDPGPTEINRSFGLSWSIGGWLVRNFLDTIG